MSMPLHNIFYLHLYDFKFFFKTILFILILLYLEVTGNSFEEIVQNLVDVSVSL